MTTTQKTTITQELDDMAKDDSPSVVAYRVGRLEKTQAEGFDKINEKLDKYIDGFVPKYTYEDDKNAADKIHIALRKEIEELKAWREKLVAKIAITSISLVGTLILVILGLAKYNVHF